MHLPVVGVITLIGVVITLVGIVVTVAGWLA